MLVFFNLLHSNFPRLPSRQPLAPLDFLLIVSKKRGDFASDVKFPRTSIGFTEKMTSKAEKDRGKQIEDKCQALLTEMLRDEDNKYCVDCDAKGPRWASWNLGIFLCIRCAGIHRNLGVHISKVKSVNLDTWTPEQVVSLQQMGNSRARAVYEANIPDNFRRPQSDSALEAFVRAKYEHKKYIAKEWVPTPVPNVKQSWERELDEEAERQRRRKREAKQVRSVRNEAPQPLPKPREGAATARNSSSPRPQRAVAQNKLDLFFDSSLSAPDAGAVAPSDDAFSGFLSAPAAATPSKPATAAATDELSRADGGRTAEEESFFNQPAPTSQEKRQLTKDSILALYGPAAGQPPTQPAAFGMPAGAAFPPQQAAFGSFGHPPLGASNGPFNLGATQNNSMFNTASAQNAFGLSGAQNNQFNLQGAQNGQFNLPGNQNGAFNLSGPQTAQFNMQGPHNGQFNMQGPPNGQFSMQGSQNAQFSMQGSQNAQFNLPASQNAPFGQQPGALGSNPFFNMAGHPAASHGFQQMPQLPQQMGRMNLGNQPANQTSIPGQSLATNLWQ